MHPTILNFLVFAAVAVSSCAANSQEPSPLTSTDGLVRALQQQGVAVMRAGAMPPSAYPFFSVAAERIVVNGEDVQVFEYPSAARADSDAARVSPTGSPIGQTQISWMDTPNFYRRDRLILLYVGHTVQVMNAIEAVVGPRFAGGPR